MSEAGTCSWRVGAVGQDDFCRGQKIFVVVVLKTLLRRSSIIIVAIGVGLMFVAEASN